MSKTQATFGELDPNATDTAADTATPGSELASTAGVEVGDSVTLDHATHDPAKMYEVVEVTAGSLTLSRDGSPTVIQDKRDGWVIRGSSFDVTPFYIGEHGAAVACSDCGESLDPADAGERVNYTYTCEECLADG